MLGDATFTMENCVPSHCSMSVSLMSFWMSVWPTATHQVALTHETPCS